MMKVFPLNGTNRTQVRFSKGLLQNEQPFIFDFQDITVKRWVNKSGSK